MSFEQEIETKNNREAYQNLKNKAAQINSQITVWSNEFDVLRAKVDTTKQSELDTRKTQFIDQIKATLGIT